MDPCEIVNEEDFDYSTMSESSFVTTGSSSSGDQNQDIKNKGAAEPTRKVKKLRSIKLVRLPSLRLTTRQARVQLDSLSTFPSGIASLLQLDQADISDASPNYMKTTTSSDARKESLQKSSRILTRRSSFKPSKSLTRLSSTKYRRSLMRKSSGGSDLKGKLKKSRSIKTRNRSSIASSNDADTSANQLKERSHCDVKDAHFQASSCSPESSLSSNDKSEKSSKNLKPNLASGNKSMRAITRTPSLRPQRILTKMNSIRTKRPSMKKYSQMVDSSIQKATCSSVLKDSKFPDHLELQPGGSEYERISAMKVCTYSYCSLHGHRHSDLPPLKRFVSMRRRQLKTQRSIKLESRSFNRAKRSTKAKKGMQASKMGCQTDAAIPETTQKSREITSIRKMAEPEADFNGESNYGGDDEDTNNYECVGESILEEVLHPRLCLNKKLQLSELSTEESKEYCTDKKGEGTVASNSHNYFLPVDHPEHANTIVQKVENPGQCDILPFDDIAGNCHEEIPAGGEFLQNVNEARFSGLNFDAYKGDRELKTSEAMTSTSLARKPIDKFRSLSAKAFEDASRINDAISSASTCDQLVEQTSERGEKNEDPLQDTQFPGTDSEPDRFSGLNFDAYKGDPELKTSETMTSTSSAREPIDKSRSLSAKAFEDASAINDVISYASTCDQLVEQTSDREEKNEDPQQDNQFPGTDSEPDRLSGLNFDAYKGDPELKTSEAMTSTGSAQEPTDESRSLSAKAFEDASTINDDISSASTCDQLVEQTSEREENNEDPLQDNQFPETDSEPNRFSGLNFDAYKGDPELKTSEAMTSTSSAREPIDKSRSLSAKAFEDARTINDVISYASTCDLVVEQTSDIEEKNEDPLQDNQFPGIDSEPHRFSGLNFDAYKGETELKTSEAMTSTDSAREPTDKSRSLRTKAFEDASTINDVISSASTCEQLVEQTSEREEKNEDPLQDNQFPGTDSEPNRFSGLNFDAYKADPELNTSEAMTSTSSAREPIDKSRSLRAKAIEDASTINGAISSVSTCDQLVEQTSDREEKNEDLLQDNQFPGTDSEPDCNSPVVEKTQMEKQKHAGLWTLIYQHMASGIASDYEMQPTVNKMDKEQGEDANTLPAMNNSDSCGDFSGKDQGMEVYDHDRGSHKIELYQRSAIKLVQEAFDKILSEIPDHSSDDQSTKIDSMLDKGEKIHAASGFDSGKESTEQDQAEMRLNEYTMHGPEGQKTQSDVESKSNQQAPKSWSNLKKIIILKRFVKALEKVRNFNPRKLQHLPVQLEPEAEKIYLRHQAMEDRKNSEAWMLDYALQQVISTLAPAQKRKVALLVQAFETIVPLPETGTSPTYHVAASSHATPAQTFTASSYENGSGKGKENNFGISLRKSSFPKEDQDQVSNSYTSEEDFPESSSEVNKPCSESGSTHTAPSILTSEFTSTGLKEKIGDLNHDNGDQNSIAKDDDHPGPTNYCLLEPGEADLSDKPSPESADVATSSHDEVSLNGEILQEVPVEVSLISALEVQDRDFEFNSETLVSDCRIDLTGEHSDGTKSQIQKNLAGSIADDNAHISVSVSELQEESSKATEGENVLQNKCFQEFSAHEESKFSSADRAHEKQKNMRLWYLIYKHMVSGSASILEEGPDKEEQADDANTSYGMDNGCSHQGFSQDKYINNHKAGNQKIELQQIEAIRMVEEAIDEIPVPDIQDDSHDDQSVSSDVIRDQDFLERQPDEGGESYISNYIGCAKESFGESSSTKIEQSSMLDPKEPYLIPEKNAIADKEKTAFMEENKPKPPAQKNWSNLKRLILLKRFVKALEKVKKLNLREPQFLPLEPEKDPEKVHLRHQDVEDRKNADEWMLDYALQKVVTKLTPARKRKVQLLVEAFESVMPTIGS